MNQKIAASAAAAALLAGLLSGCAPASEPSGQPAQSASPAPTEAAAEKPYEGTTLNVMLAYGGAEASFDAFTEKTGIKVEYVEISTGKALAQLQAENGNTTADIWFGGGVDSYIAATDLGYLEQYVSPEAENINPAYSDKDGYWTGLALVPAGFLVNNDVLAERNLEAPKTWETWPSRNTRARSLWPLPPSPAPSTPSSTAPSRPMARRRAGKSGAASMRTWTFTPRAAASLAPSVPPVSSASLSWP